MEKLTKRSVYEALLKMVETGTLEITEDELKTFCENEIALLDKKAEKEQITVPATETTKARKIMGYRVASAEAAE